MGKKELIDLEELEKKYFESLKSMIENNTEVLKKGLERINASKDHWKGKIKLDNKIQRGVQEMVRGIIFRGFKDWETFTLPISSDTAFETDDAIINLDIKTVKNIDNDARKGYFQIRRNQTSYPNKDVKGIPWDPHQPLSSEVEPGKYLPILSYFVKFIWARENGEIEIKEIVICSIPNGKLAEIYGKNLIVNYKTYEYADKKRIKGDTARFNIKKILKPKLTKGWERIEKISFNSED